MGKHSLAALEAASGGPISYMESMSNMGHSAVIGAILMFITIWATYQTLVPGAMADEDDEDEIDSPSELILSSSNVMFICFGMTAVMTVVNNNLARAFTIGATIAMIRFKIKLNAKAINMGLFYGALIGMACGVGQTQLAWVAVLFFGVSQMITVTLARLGDKAKRALIVRRGNLRSMKNDPLPATPLAAQSPVDQND